MNADDTTATTTGSVFSDDEKLAFGGIVTDVVAQAAAGSAPTKAECAALVEEFFAKRDTPEG